MPSSMLDRAEQDNAKVQEVLRLFLQKLNFKGVSLDEALRSMVVRFRLPGEAQQMDRFVLCRIFQEMTSSEGCVMRKPGLARRSLSCRTRE